MAFVATIIAASAAVTAGTSIYSAVETSKAQKKAGQAAEEQNAQQQKLLADAKAKTDQSKIEADNIAARDAARTKQRNAAAAAQGRQDTILTGSLGLTDQPSGQRKTLLGA